MLSFSSENSSCILSRPPLHSSLSECWPGRRGLVPRSGCSCEERLRGDTMIYKIFCPALTEQALDLQAHGAGQTPLCGICMDETYMGHMRWTLFHLWPRPWKSVTHFKGHHLFKFGINKKYGCVPLSNININKE